MSKSVSRSGVTPREREMRKLLARCKRSGLNRAEFARRQKLNPATVAWWASEIRRRDAARASAPTPSPSFVDVVVRPEALAASFEVELAGGRVVRVPAGFVAEDLARLLSVVEKPC